MAAFGPITTAPSNGEDAIDSRPAINLQDRALCENAYRRFRSRGHGAGRFATGEDRARRCDRCYVRAMCPGITG